MLGEDQYYVSDRTACPQVQDIPLGQAQEHCSTNIVVILQLPSCAA